MRLPGLEVPSELGVWGEGERVTTHRSFRIGHEPPSIGHFVVERPSKLVRNTFSNPPWKGRGGGTCCGGQVLGSSLGLPCRTFSRGTFQLLAGRELGWDISHY